MADQKITSPGAVLLTVCVAQFMVPLMLTAVGVALPSIGKEFKASAGQLGLVEQLYILSLAMTMLTFGRLGDLAGRVRVFLTGLVLFTVMTTSLGFVQSIGMLLVQRFFQGMGASMLLSGSMALIASAFPPEVRGRKIGIVSAFTYSGLSSGPVLGGFITTHLGWRYIFWLVVPFGIVASLLCFYRMRGQLRVARSEKMDWQGSLIYAAGVALVMLGASHLSAGSPGLAMMSDRIRIDLLLRYLGNPYSKSAHRHLDTCQEQIFYSELFRGNGQLRGNFWTDFLYEPLPAVCHGPVSAPGRVYAAASACFTNGRFASGGEDYG